MENEKEGSSDVEIITVMRFYDVSQAEMAVGILEDEGIKCGLVGANLYNVNFFYGLASGGIKLEVRRSDAARAVELLRQAFSSEQAIDDAELTQQAGAEDDDEKCPHCGSANIAFEKYARRTFFLGIVLFGFPLPVRKNEYHCLDCGNRWR